MGNFRWSNIPIPEAHAVPLVVGVLLHVWLPLKVFEGPWLTHVLGWPILLLGTLLAVWAVATTKDVDVSRPPQIIASRPYSFSRNPMYVGWTIIYVGIAILVNTWWLLLFLPALIVFTHYFVIRQEEKRLEQQFGDAYRQYRSRVRRYL